MARYLSTSVSGATKTYKFFGTAGTYTFTTPTGVTSLNVGVWGGGGNHLYQVLMNWNCDRCSAGLAAGPGGGFACGTIATSPGTAYTVTVGSCQGTSSFGTLLSATGGSNTSLGFSGVSQTPGTGCASASVQSAVTASGGSAPYTYWVAWAPPGSSPVPAYCWGGGGSGSPYGTGGGGSGGGGGWGPTASASSFAGGGAGYPAYCCAGGGSAGSPKSITLTTATGTAVWQTGGAAKYGTGGDAQVLSTYLICGGFMTQVNTYQAATDCCSTDPFLRLDSLSGGGGAGWVCGYAASSCYMSNGKIGIDGATGGGGGLGGNGGFGAGGGYGGNGGFGGGAGYGGTPGCGGGAAMGGAGGQGAVLVVYSV